MNRYTYRDLVRRYAIDVANGHADADLTARQRRLVQVMLNLAANAGVATCEYPPTDETRTRVVASLSNIMWDARPLVEAASPRASTDIGIAHERAITILQGI